MFVRKSTYDTDMALEKGRTERIASKWAAAVEKLDDANSTIEHKDAEIDGLSIALRAVESQLSDARAQLKVFTDRRDRAKLNLRQYRGSNAVAGGQSDTTLNA